METSKTAQICTAWECAVKIGAKWANSFGSLHSQESFTLVSHKESYKAHASCFNQPIGATERLDPGSAKQIRALRPQENRQGRPMDKITASTGEAGETGCIFPF